MRTKKVLTIEDINDLLNKKILASFLGLGLLILVYLLIACVIKEIREDECYNTLGKFARDKQSYFNCPVN